MGKYAGILKGIDDGQGAQQFGGKRRKVISVSLVVTKMERKNEMCKGRWVVRGYLKMESWEKVIIYITGTG